MKIPFTSLHVTIDGKGREPESSTLTVGQEMKRRRLDLGLGALEDLVIEGLAINSLYKFERGEWQVDRMPYLKVLLLEDTYRLDPEDSPIRKLIEGQLEEDISLE